MLEEFSQPESAGDGRRALHLAQGIVMALRRTDQTSAFAEMINVAHIYAVPVQALADALIDLVAPTASMSTDSPAHSAVIEQWGFNLRTSAHSSGRQREPGCAADVATS